MVPRFGVHIRRPIVSVPVVGLVSMAVAMVRYVGSRIGRMRAAMRRDRPGMKTRQDHREEDEKGDKQTHAALASALWAP